MQYYTLYREMRAVVERHKVDRRRLEAAHFQFAILQVAMWYPQHINMEELHLHSALQTSLQTVVAVYMVPLCASMQVSFLPSMLH